MIKLLLICVGIYIAYKLFANDFIHKKNKDTEKEKKETDRKKAAGELAKDPVCGTYVSIEDSIKVRDGETVHHFCSYECRESFLEQLEKGGREIPEHTSKDNKK